MKTCVWITTSFIGFHRWKEAPESVAFLRDFHRHVFHVKLGKQVVDLDREIEFISLKKALDIYVQTIYEGKRFELSCEMIADCLLHVFDAQFVEVSEDGENGARVERDS